MTETLTLNIWDREFTLPVEYDCYKGEKITDEQRAAVKNFSGHMEWIEASKLHIVEYCREQVLEDEDNQKKDNIFSYIKPDYLLVKRDAENPRVAMMCKYRYDPEHGLAVVFSYDGEINIGIQDIIL